ncbi:methylated-DNA--protein-cysteine methyltransferase [Amylibacter ulvae]|uniref:Methylated-DNA--protein-cysteine methyltransferase n=1 Tax=Paramylibacter ulvae TaxID=1651968 RepID=A0ABQ3D0B6_9RHOB|nr:methylated-DNA--[protein]-cysteine S-methyltransferase [Amylibacter ulvae]GHA51704.1 methylated-DNA--protein-cysteine methyltransferase [Amylibacter ulvae]
MNCGVIKTPVGFVSVVEQDGAITQLNWGGENSGTRTGLIKSALFQLEQYFNNDRDEFDLPLNPEGSLFQQLVFRQMSKIPKGRTVTYGDIATALDAPAQAIGQACGANPIPIIIPCHRVLGANSLGGYSGEGGVETKVKLLRFEGAAGLLI